MAILSLPLMLSACSTGIEVVSERSETPVVVNGERSDWTGNLAQSDDRKMEFDFRNDSKFLYILGTTPDRANAMKMMLRGLTMSIRSNEGEELKGSLGMSAGLFVLELQIPLTGDEISQELLPVSSLCFSGCFS